jgi:hypothetical protein
MTKRPRTPTTSTIRPARRGTFDSDTRLPPVEVEDAAIDSDPIAASGWKMRASPATDGSIAAPLRSRAKSHHWTVNVAVPVPSPTTVNARISSVGIGM